MRGGRGRVDRARITPGRCLLASIKFPPPLANYRLSFPFGLLLHSARRRRHASGRPPSWIPELNENGNVLGAILPHATTFPPSYLSPSSPVPESIPVWRYGIAPNLFPRPAGAPCTTKWVSPAEKAAVCLPVTTRVALISLAYIRLDPGPFLRHFVKCKYSPAVEIAPRENIAADTFRSESMYSLAYAR